MKVQVAYADAVTEAIVTVDVDEGCDVEHAVRQSGLLPRVAVSGGTLVYAVFGRRVDASAVLVAGDRVEITRPLLCDARSARSARAARKPRPRIGKG